MLGETECPKVVGVKQTLKMMSNDINCKFVYIAKNAEKKVVQPVIDLAESKSFEIVYIDTMKELGKICDIDVGAAAALVLKS